MKFQRDRPRPCGAPAYRLLRMTSGEYVQAIAALQTELKRLVDATMSESGVADGASKADLEPLLQRHVELVKLSTQLTERVFSRYKAST